MHLYFSLMLLNCLKKFYLYYYAKSINSIDKLNIYFNLFKKFLLIRKVRYLDSLLILLYSNFLIY